MPLIPCHICALAEVQGDLENLSTNLGLFFRSELIAEPRKLNPDHTLSSSFRIHQELRTRFERRGLPLTECFKKKVPLKVFYVHNPCFGINLSS